jgi:hypothetical protein
MGLKKISHFNITGQKIASLSNNSIMITKKTGVAMKDLEIK